MYQKQALAESDLATPGLSLMLLEEIEDMKPAIDSTPAPWTPAETQYAIERGLIPAPTIWIRPLQALRGRAPRLRTARRTSGTRLDG